MSKNRAKKHYMYWTATSGIHVKSIVASLSEGEMQQILTEKHSGKTKQMTNWSAPAFKGKLKFFRLKLLNIKLELSTENLK